MEPLQKYSRAQAIDLLRSELVKMCDDKHSLCSVAAKKNIFCKGFNRCSSAELFQKFDFIAKAMGAHTREELEDIANLWELERQRLLHCTITCDMECVEREFCRGWDEFDNRQLEQFVLEVCGKKVFIEGVEEAMQTPL